MLELAVIHWAELAGYELDIIDISDRFRGLGRGNISEGVGIMAAVEMLWSHTRETGDDLATSIENLKDKIAVRRESL